MVARGRARLGVLVCAACLAGVAAGTAEGAQVSGAVEADGTGVAASTVTLYAGRGGAAPRRLGTATTGDDGRFTIRYAAPAGPAVIYAVADGGDVPAPRALRLMAVADPRVGPPARLTLNELTTVASAYAMARFLHGSRVTGAGVGMRNAAATARGLADPATGRVGAVVARPPNGTATTTLGALRTLSAILGGCTRGTVTSCRALFQAAAPPRGPAPRDTLAAVHAIALNPANDVRGIYRLRKGVRHRPLLPHAPSSWVLSLKHTAGGFDGPGRMAFDSQGNIWVTNNFQPPGTGPGLYTVALDPTGAPRLGGAVGGGGIMGVWWGIAVDQQDRVWLSNFTGSDPNPFNSPAFTGGTAAALLTRDGIPLSGPDGITAGGLQAPQGIAVDQRGNVWIANHVGNTVTLYPGGDPGRARTISGGGLFKPFAVEVDGRGNVWVGNGAIDADVKGSLTRISPDGVPTGPFVFDRMRSPQGIAIDSGGDLWVASLVDQTLNRISPAGRLKARYRASSMIGPWGVAVDGDDNVWVASFPSQKLTQFCGRRLANCPPGAKTGDVLSPAFTGFTNGGLQHLTAVQIDQSGNVWVANNWANIVPTIGGDGLVEFIGAAAPVATPLIGPPRTPR
jgi:sugar lactone lactonase YvrE